MLHKPTGQIAADELPGDQPAGESPRHPPATGEPSADASTRIEVAEAGPRAVSRLRGAASFLVSAIVHLLLLVLLALIAVGAQRYSAVHLEISTSPAEATQFESLALTPAEAPQLSEPTLPELTALQPLQQPGPLTLLPDAPIAAAPIGALPQWAHPENIAAIMRPHLGPVGGGFEGRDAESRARLATLRGATPESERAVEMGLHWLALHQLEDGSWRFKHHEGPCRGACRNPGTVDTTTGATGLALLPFLGAGYTSEVGPYQETVKKGLYYLTSRMLITPQGGDLQEGTMYAHGIASIALCEAYAMTGDPTLREPAQLAVDFICAAQHEKGGWRYYPGMPGDTTVFGWQMMALKSAKLANLEVPSPVIENAMSYLDSVQDQGGAVYGYLRPERGPSPTAIGLLTRMYYGWPRDDTRLARGVGYLDGLGPSRTDMYFNYYAGQVMHHYQGGSVWERWNEQVREHLIATQATEGHERGSWYFADRHGSAGGRHYTTAMSLMILEVYYRHMPLYDDPAVETGF
jgi:hypothetical protein